MKLEQFRRIHIVGIGGAGMSAIGRVLQARGFAVQGSDRSAGRLVNDLCAEGIPVILGHAAENLGAADLVLASSAIPDDNVELQAARERGIPVLRRSDILPLLLAEYQVIAVAGAHGKTTVTGMIATVLLAAGMDPSYIIGGIVANLGGNARAGKGTYFIIEADEYRNTFLALEPDIAVVTNVEFDHPDCFASPRFLRLAFGDFVSRIRPEGALVTCNDDPVAHAVGVAYHAGGGDLHLYGLAEGEGVAWRAVDIAVNDLGGVDFTALYHERPQGRVRLSIPGAHNVLNALATLAVVTQVGVSFEVAAVALETFSGTARRFELLGSAAAVTVIDDYAHHPTQIRVVLAAARARYPGQRLLVVWQPHTFSRIKALWSDFMRAFTGADYVIVLPVYAAREVDDGSFNQNDLAAQLEHPVTVSALSLDDAVQQLADVVAGGDVVLLMGAGDEYVIGERLLARLRKENAVCQD